MSQDSLPRYELLTQVSEGPVRTYHALARTGAVVMVHFVAGSPVDEAARARALIERLEPAERRKVLEVTEVDGGVAVVTKFILDFQSLFSWLGGADAAAGASSGALPGDVAPAPPPAPAMPSAPTDGPGEFTRAFRAVGADAPAEEANRSSEASGSPPAAVPPPPADEPGEFTRAFRALGGSSPEAESSTGQPSLPSRPTPDVVPEPPRPAEADLDSADGPVAESPSEGEFTRLFRSYGDLGGGPVLGSTAGPTSAQPTTGESREPPPPPLGGGTGQAAADSMEGLEPTMPAVGGDKPGEFTSLFGAITPPDLPPDPPAPPSDPTPRPPPNPEPSTGGRAPDLPSPNFAATPPPSGPPQPRVPEVKWRGDDPSAPTRPDSGPVAPGPDAGGPPPADGPGEYTRIFGRTQIPNDPGPAPLPSPSQENIDYRYPASADRGGHSSGRTGEDNYLDRLAGGQVQDEARPPTPQSPPSPSRGETPPPPGSPVVPPWLGGAPGEQRKTPAPPAGPSEYTRIISAQTPPAAPQTPAAPVVPPAPPAAATPVAQPQRSPVLLLVGVAIVVLVTLALILYFALRSPALPDAEGPTDDAVVTEPEASP